MVQQLSRRLCTASSRPRIESFIALAKREGADALAHRPFPASDRFDSCLHGMHVGELRAGRAECHLVVLPALQNSYARGWDG